MTDFLSAAVVGIRLTAHCIATVYDRRVLAVVERACMYRRKNSANTYLRAEILVLVFAWV